MQAAPESAKRSQVCVMPAKSGLDGHDRASGISSALRGPGMKPAYAGLHQTYEQVAEMPIQEAAAIGPFNRLGATVTLVPREEDLLIERGG